MVEATDKDRSIRANNTSHGDTRIFQCMIDVLHHQSLLGVQREKLIPGDIEKRAVKVNRVFREIMTTLHMELNEANPVISMTRLLPRLYEKRVEPTVPPCSGSG